MSLFDDITPPEPRPLVDEVAAPPKPKGPRWSWCPACGDKRRTAELAANGGVCRACKWRRIRRAQLAAAIEAEQERLRSLPLPPGVTRVVGDEK